MHSHPEISSDLLTVLAKKFSVLGRLANYLDSSEDKELIKERENRMGAAKVYEYIIAYILKGKVAHGVGYDIHESEIIKNKKIEVKTTMKSFFRKDGKLRKSSIIITNKFKPNNKIDLKSDIFIITSLQDRMTFILDSKMMEPHIKVSGSQLLFGVPNLYDCDSAIIDWSSPAGIMSKECYHELYAESNKLDPEKNIKKILDRDIYGVTLEDILEKAKELLKLIKEYVKK